ncbi:MAG TPA: PadR family transcriptional regulator [Actinotalea caeni]|uniref:PadR family transcriptional regulator n=1 Tax=Actinotalea caeni TaxID=1348467 RepID=UPI0012E1C94B|nr:PadR family transcriptional regulator [Actinotalea caeni]HLV54491.1 PadR family transcriptional regulator [Actinotalea caeni]
MSDARDPQLLKGVLPMLVIGLLGAAESYGYELVTRLRTAGLDGIAPGTVYPTLTRLEREGRLTSRLVPSPSGPARKYYRPTPAGEAYYASALAAWDELGAVVGAVATRREDDR